MTHTTDQCQTLDESFPFLPTGWQADYIGDQFILGPGPQAVARASRWETPTDPGRGVGLRISNDFEPQLPVVGEDIPGPAVRCHVGTARLLEMVDRRTTVVGRDFRLPCSDSDDSDGDVLCAEGHDGEVRQINLRNEWSVDSWTADDSCGEGCAQLDDFNWFLPTDDRVGDLHAPGSQVDLSDSESDVDDVEPDLVPVQMTTMAVESLCPLVVAQTRPKEGCDPMMAVDTRRVSIDQDTDVVRGIYVMPDCIPAVMPMLAAAPQAASEVAQRRHRGDCSVNLLLPVDGSIEPLDDDASEVLSAGREPAGGRSEVGSDVCVVQDLLPTVVSVRTVVAEMWMERFVLVLEACLVVSMTSTVARTFGPALSEEYSHIVLAGGGSFCGIPPGRGRVRYSASVCPANG